MIYSQKLKKDTQEEFLQQLWISYKNHKDEQEKLLQ